MPTTPHISRNFKPAAVALLSSRIRWIKPKCYARHIMLCLCDNERRRFLGISLSRTEFRAAYLLPNVLMASLLPVFEPGLVRAEINNACAFALCLLAAADQPDRPRSFEEARPYTAQEAMPPSAGGTLFRLSL